MIQMRPDLMTRRKANQPELADKQYNFVTVYLLVCQMQDASNETWQGEIPCKWSYGPAC